MNNMPKVFNGKYALDKKISSGAFGIVFKGVDKSSHTPVAIKLEKSQRASCSTLDREIYILGRLQGLPGVPKLLWSGQENSFHVMIIELLGKDLS
jgi:serine/threonine protein kinase